jgi:hypothetical protein
MKKEVEEEEKQRLLEKYGGEENFGSCFGQYEHPDLHKLSKECDCAFWDGYYEEGEPEGNNYYRKQLELCSNCELKNLCQERSEADVEKKKVAERKLLKFIKKHGKPPRHIKPENLEKSQLISPLSVCWLRREGS